MANSDWLRAVGPLLPSVSKSGAESSVVELSSWYVSRRRDISVAVREGKVVLI